MSGVGAVCVVRVRVAGWANERPTPAAAAASPPLLTRPAAATHRPSWSPGMSRGMTGTGGVRDVPRDVGHGGKLLRESQLGNATHPGLRLCRLSSEGAVCLAASLTQQGVWECTDLATTVPQVLEPGVSHLVLRVEF